MLCGSTCFAGSTCDLGVELRILFTSTPAVGHVHPMVPLARAFRSRGDPIAWATGAEVCPMLAKDGFEAMRSGQGADESRQEFYDRFPEYAYLAPTDGPPFMFPRLFGTVRAPQMLMDLLPIVRDWKPDLIIHDAAEFAGSIAAGVAGIPSVTHSFGALTPKDRVTAASQEVAHLWEQNGLEARPFAGNYEFLYLDMYPESLSLGERSHVPLVQPIRSEGFALPGNEPLPAGLNGDSTVPLVYFTLGTVFMGDGTLFAAVISGLRDLPIRLIVTVGPHGDPDALGEQPPNVHVARYLRQSDLLPLCTAVVSHAGSGTLLAAMTAGLPQLCLPQAADQFGNAAACARAGAGIQIQPEHIASESVRDAARRLLTDNSFREQAGNLADEIAGMPSPKVVADVLHNRYAG
jgi:UDP:flavonoid glycosyltransferase YjiC (YdhE family)